MKSPMKSYVPRWPLVVGIFAYTLLFRLIPYFLKSVGWELDSASVYAWNFSPMIAVCLFSAACFKNRSLALALPLATMLASDLGIWAVSGRFDYGFYPLQPYIYLSWTACWGLGLILRNKHPLFWLPAAFVGSTFYFLLTNFAHWAVMGMYPPGMYPPTWEGLVACYEAALPFYRNSLIGTGVFGAALFSPLFLRRIAEDKISQGALKPVAIKS